MTIKEFFGVGAIALTIASIPTYMYVVVKRGQEFCATQNMLYEISGHDELCVDNQNQRHDMTKLKKIQKYGLTGFDSGKY